MSTSNQTTFTEVCEHLQLEHLSIQSSEASSQTIFTEVHNSPKKMNTKEMFEKILKRNKYVISCGNARNNTYSQYLNASLSYDNLKKGFYIALELSRDDADVAEEQLQRYEHLVKHFDQQLLKQFKERDYVKEKIEMESDIQQGTFRDRITKGLLRNRMYFEFIDDKNEFDESKKSFYNEISLALRDGLITDIDRKIHDDSMKIIGKKFEEGITEIRQNYNQKREQGHRGRGRQSCGQEGRGRQRWEQEGRGRQGGRQEDRGRGRNSRAQRRDGCIQDRNDRGRHGGGHGGKLCNRYRPY